MSIDRSRDPFFTDQDLADVFLLIEELGPGGLRHYYGPAFCRQPPRYAPRWPALAQALPTRMPGRSSLNNRTAGRSRAVPCRRPGRMHSSTSRWGRNLMSGDGLQTFMAAVGRRESNGGALGFCCARCLVAGRGAPAEFLRGRAASNLPGRRAAHAQHPTQARATIYDAHRLSSRPHERLFWAVRHAERVGHSVLISTVPDRRPKGLTLDKVGLSRCLEPQPFKNRRLKPSSVRLRIVLARFVMPLCRKKLFRLPVTGAHDDLCAAGLQPRAGRAV